ncbi:MAG: hypothetical protein K0R55_338 [Sporomusa sp.]|nr:hypothetical protein [Sporomusa sp.]
MRLYSERADTRKMLLKNEDINISVKILSGGLGSAKLPTSLTSLDDIATFIKTINQTNDFPLKPGVLSATLYPYTNTIPQGYTNITNAMSDKLSSEAFSPISISTILCIVDIDIGELRWAPQRKRLSRQ